MTTEPGTTPNPSTEPEPWPPTPPAAPPPPKPWYRRTLTGIIAAVGAVLAYTGVKFAIGFLAVSVIGSATTAAFGTPWQRLPSDVRNPLEDRLEAAYGSDLDDLSDEALATRVETDVTNGIVRLDNDTLITRLALFTNALNEVAVADCATFFRSAMGGELISDEVSSHLEAALDADDYAAWAEIAVQAIEAERRGSPAARTNPDETVNAAYEAVLAKVSDGTIAVLSVSDVDPLPDADLCAAGRDLYTTIGTMDRTTMAVIALDDITPVR